MFLRRLQRGIAIRIPVRGGERQTQQHLVFHQPGHIKRRIGNEIFDIIALVFRRRQMVFIRHEKKHRIVIQFKFQRPEATLANQFELAGKMQRQLGMPLRAASAGQAVMHFSVWRKKLVAQSGKIEGRDCITNFAGFPREVECIKSGMVSHRSRMV